MSQYKTEQEKFWQGEFGDEYTSRNLDAQYIISNISLFSKILSRTNGIHSCLELGSNRGLNLIALNNLIKDVSIQAVEINENAANECAKIPNVKVYQGSALEFPYEDNKYDLTFTKGVLIHINPSMLDTMYETLYKASKRYVMVCEYYNPTPVEVEYRGNTGRLFKRDFAGEMMDKYDDLRLIDYGFVYHRDNNFKQDDATWFLMEKC